MTSGVIVKSGCLPYYEKLQFVLDHIAAARKQVFEHGRDAAVPAVNFNCFVLDLRLLIDEVMQDMRDIGKETALLDAQINLGWQAQAESKLVKGRGVRR